MPLASNPVQGQGPLACEIQQERAIGMTASQGEIVHAEDLWGDNSRTGSAADYPQPCVPAPPKSSLPAEPHPSCPTESEADGEQVCRQPASAPCPRCREAGQSFRKDAAGAAGVAAEELVDAEPPGDLIATPREIGERPGITTIDMACRDLACRASGCRLCGRDQEGDLGVHIVEVPGV